MTRMSIASNLKRYCCYDSFVRSKHSLKAQILNDCYSDMGACTASTLNTYRESRVL